MEIAHSIEYSRKLASPRLHLYSHSRLYFLKNFEFSLFLHLIDSLSACFSAFVVFATDEAMGFPRVEWPGRALPCAFGRLHAVRFSALPARAAHADAIQFCAPRVWHCGDDCSDGHTMRLRASNVFSDERSLDALCQLSLVLLDRPDAKANAVYCQWSGHVVRRERAEQKADVFLEFSKMQGGFWRGAGVSVDSIDILHALHLS